MRILITSLLVFITFILQGTVFRYVEILGISPDLLLVIIVCFSLLRHEREGAAIGFVAGLLQDLFFSQTLGVNALLYLLIGYFSGKPFKAFYSENYLFPFVMIGIATLFYNFSYYIFHFLLRARLDFFYFAMNIIFPATVYNMIAAVPAFILIYLGNSKIEAHEKRHRRLFDSHDA